MTNMREVIAEADGYELVKYVTGEHRIEHPASQTCSIWLNADEVAEILADPAIMSRWATEENMSEEEEEAHTPEAPWTGWHFLTEDCTLRYNDGREVTPGKMYRAEGAPVLCKSGMHASASALDALRYAPGPIICRVELSGDLIEGEDKAVARCRKVRWMADATRTLHLFAVWCAEHALIRERKAGHEPDQRSWNAIKIKRAWLDGKATDEELAAARDAAEDAAWDAARAAAQNAALAAARDAARAAVWAAVRSAVWDAAWTAARLAAWDAERADTRAAEKEAQARRLESMLLALAPSPEDSRPTTGRSMSNA